MRFLPLRERRRKKSRAAEIQSIAIRMIRENVPLDELKMREDDPKGLTEHVRACVGRLIETKNSIIVENDKEPKIVRPKVLAEVPENNADLLPGSDDEARERFIKAYIGLREGMLRATVLILARAGLGKKMSYDELLSQMNQIYPKTASIASHLKPGRNLNPRYLERAGLGINVQGGYRSANMSYSLCFID